MKKIIPILIVGALVLSGIGAIAIEADENDILEKKASLFVSEPVLSSFDNYVKVNLPQETSLSMEEGKPMMPIITEVFAFEQGTEITDVQVNFDTVEYELTDPILPAPKAVPLLDTYNSNVEKRVMDEEVYASSECYPSEQSSVKYAFGMYQGERSEMVIVKVYSQYIASEDKLIVPTGEIDISIKYNEPVAKPVFAEEYDMLIITPAKFESNFDDFIAHKEGNGISVIVETLEDIYATYDGRHEPEDIKLAIQNAIEEYNINYVLLAGGRQRQTMKWWLPEFRNWNDDGWESGFASDLYYADVYKNGGADFEDWDSNENEIFGEFKGLSKDEMDFIPDVTVGRIPFHYGFELNSVLKKVIDYETNADDSWFKDAIMIAGDTFPNGNTFYEGEMETGYTAEMLEDDGFTVEKLWTSMDTLTGVPDVVQAISGGAGFVHFAGHGNPSTWSTHPPDDADTWITGLSFTDMQKLRNRDKIPFILVGGCHNAQFNATMGNIIHGILTYGFKEYFDLNASDDEPDEDGDFGKFWLKEWVPRDWCSWVLLKKKGGAIGSVGMTSLGYGYVDQHAGEGLGGWIEPRMFHAYAEQDLDILGEIHDQAIIDYVNIIGYVNEDQIDRKTIEAFVLLGDPSLKLGGY